MSTEADTVRALKENQDAAIRALEANDRVAYRALAEQEARLMDVLRAVWSET